MKSIPTPLEMLKAGVHFGHKASKWHPKMKPYIYGTREGIHIIDLEKTGEKLKEAMDFVRETAAKGGTVLFVGTKLQAKEVVQRTAEEAGMPYIVERWLGGTFTNFSTISKLTNKLKKLEEGKEKGDFDKYTKKERLKMDKEIERLHLRIGGIKDLRRLPEAVFIVDLVENKIAAREARKAGVPIVAMTDTNNNPEKVDYPVPANNDAVHSVEMIVSLVAQAAKEGREKAPVTAPKPEEKKK